MTIYSVYSLILVCQLHGLHFISLRKLNISTYFLYSLLDLSSHILNHIQLVFLMLLLLLPRVDVAEDADVVVAHFKVLQRTVSVR